MSEEPVLKSRRREGVDTTVVAVGNVRFGDGSYPVLAGPSVVESEEQIVESAMAIAEAGGSVLRAGTYRAENSPYAFKGLGDEGLMYLVTAGLEAGLPTSTEVLEPGQAAHIAAHVDLLEIGPDNMQNFVLLQAAGRTGRPVMLHRGPSATIDEWLMAAEYILAVDNHSVILCERGSRTFDPRTTDTLDISAIPVVQNMSHLPVVIDPSGKTTETLIPLALAGRTVGADGLIAHVHPSPDQAKGGNGSQLGLAAYHTLMDSLGVPMLRDEIDRIDRELVRLLGRRLRRSVEIGLIKAERGLALRSPDREAELIDEARTDAVAEGLDPDYVARMMELVLESSRAAQKEALEEGGQPEG